MKISSPLVDGKGLLFSMGVLALAVGCSGNEPPAGLRVADDGVGARVIFDLDERPLPAIPFPNDLATTVDPTTATGKRLNVSLQAATRLEEHVRERINQLDGFGTYAPIWVQFDQALDIRNILERHGETVADFADDAVYLVDIDPESPEYGQFQALDMGRGNFPVVMKSPNKYFDFDPRADGDSLIFESVLELDLNANQKLDPFEDTDDDGVWDFPNTVDVGADPKAPGQLMSFYERETNTLILRPLRSLRPQTTYAVVLTRELVDANGEPVRSPFAYVNHTRQTEALAPLRSLLPEAFPNRFNKELDGVAFAWSFTTQSTVRELEAIRAGMYGHGPLFWLGEQFEARLTLLHRLASSDAEGVGLTTDLSRALPILIEAMAPDLSAQSKAVFLEALDDIDYLVSGSFVTPYFLVDKDGLSDSVADRVLNRDEFDENEVFELDVDRGEASVGEDEVTWHCLVPKAAPGREPPFPVVLYGHGYGGSRLEMLGFAGQVAKFGLATCAIDNVGHGLVIPPNILEDPILTTALDRFGLGNLPGVLQHGRHRDLTNDGVADSGGDYWTADTFHTRDMVRQTTVDYMQMIRIFRSFDGQRRWPDALDESNPYVSARREIVAGWDHDQDGRPEIAGDFNGDGTVDLGGDQPYYAWGQSLGGIQSAVLAGVEPAVRAAAPTAGGAGLTDIAIRSTQGGVPEAVVLRMMGPLVLGRPMMDEAGEPTGVTRLEWLIPDAFQEVYLPFAEVEGLRDGDRVVLRNLEREKRPELVKPEDLVATAHIRQGRFRMGLAMDAIGTNERRHMLGFDPTVSVAELHALHKDEESELTPDQAAELARHTIAEPTQFGDAVVIEIYNAAGRKIRRIDTFERDVIYQNVLYPAGAPLAALTEGWGMKRQSPNFRRFFAIAQTILDGADPASYAPTYFERPLRFEYETNPEFRDGTTNVLVVPTVGDSAVPVNTGISIARIAGILDFETEDARYGMSENDFLIDRFVYEAVHWYDRFPDYPSTLFDADDLDNGTWESRRYPDRGPDSTPNADAPLRATVETDRGVSGLRLPYLDAHGIHGFDFPKPERAFDMDTFMINQIGYYFATGGTELSDDPCLESMFMEECRFYDSTDWERPAVQ